MINVSTNSVSVKEDSNAKLNGEANHETHQVLYDRQPSE